MQHKKLFSTLLAVFAVCCSARAQSQVDVTIRSQQTSADTLFFDIYLQLVSGDPVYLENSDFVFSYDSANFSSPQFGFVDGSTYLLNSNGARTTAYNYNIYTRFGEAFNAGNLTVLVQLPAFSSQSEFDSRVARIDGQDGVHRLGRFYLTGMQNVSVNPDITWKTSGDGFDTQIFSLDNNSPWNGEPTNVDAVDPDPGAEPTTNSSNITFSSISAHSVTIHIGTTGNGASRLILARAEDSIGENYPADGIMYTADAEFGDGSQIGTSGVYAVYNGTGDSVTVTGLCSGEDYYFQVYEYNGANGATENYKVPGADATEATPVVEPTVSSSNLAFSNVTATSMTLTVGTLGDGCHRLILVRASSAIGSNHPVDGTSYTANTTFGSGTQIGSSGVYTVHTGHGNEVTITGLTGGITYYFEVYEYNGEGGAEDYLIPGTQASQMTPYAEPTVNSANITFSNIGSTSMTLNIGTAGDGTNRLIMARAFSSNGSNYPSDLTTYTANAAFGSGTQIGSTGIYAVYNGSGNSVTVTGLTTGVTYYFVVYEYNGTSGAENYLTPGTEASQATSSYITANIKVFLQGPLSSGIMTTGLNSSGLIPNSHPYSGSPWSYSGTESVTSVPNSDIVDWVLVELRTGTASSTKVATKACFLKKDGTIVGTDGSSAPQFTGQSSGNYYVVIKHRNHLAIMTATAISLSSNSSQYDFTTGQSQAYGTNPMKQVGSVYAMYAGDANGNGQIKYNGSGNDRAIILGQVNANSLSVAVTNRYHGADFNLNGQIKYNGSGNDRAILLGNVNASALSIAVSTQVP
jgi:hypothetical protein